MPATRRGSILPSGTRSRLAVNFSGLVCGGLAFLLGAPSALAQRRQPSVMGTLCETDGSSAHYEEALIGTGSTMGRNTTSTTGCPNHVNWAINPNPATHSSSEVVAPAYPMLQDDAGGVTDLSESGGAIGIMFNGVALFSAFAAEDAATSYENSAISLEGGTFDPCGGHATAGGIYHYHNTAGCLQEQAMLNAETTSAEHSPQLGWSYDGFPVYGQLGPDGVEMLVCGNTGANDTYCLDLCNGYEGTIDGVDDFKYRYYGSCGFDESFFPATTNCYRGCCPDGITCGQHVEACGNAAIEGYTANYTPEAVERGLDEVYDSVLIDGDDTDLIGKKEETMDCSFFLGSYESDAAPNPGGGGGGNGSATPAPSSLPEASTQPPESSTILPTPSPTPAGGGRGPDPRTPAPSMTTEEESSTILPTPSPTPAGGGRGPDSRTSAPSMTTEEELSTNDPTLSPTPASGDDVPDSGTLAPSMPTEGSAPSNGEISAGAATYHRHTTTAAGAAAGLALAVMVAVTAVSLSAEFLV